MGCSSFTAHSNILLPQLGANYFEFTTVIVYSVSLVDVLLLVLKFHFFHLIGITALNVVISSLRSAARLSHSITIATFYRYCSVISFPFTCHKLGNFSRFTWSIDHQTSTRTHIHTHTHTPTHISTLPHHPNPKIPSSEPLLPRNHSFCNLCSSVILLSLSTSQEKLKKNPLTTWLRSENSLIA